MNWLNQKKVAIVFGLALLIFLVIEILSLHGITELAARHTSLFLFVFAAPKLGLLAVGYYFWWREVTARLRIEDELRLRERAINAARYGISISDHRLPDNPLIYVNPAFEQTTGYPAAEVIGRNCRFLQGADTDSETLDVLRRAIREGQPGEVTLLNYRKDGSPFWNHVSIAPVLDESGATTHFIGFQQDVTSWRYLEEERAILVERKRAADERREIVKELADIRYALDQAAIVAITDQTGKITFVNDKFCEISKYTRAELIGQDYGIIDPRFYSKEFIDDLWQTIVNGKTWRGEMCNRAKDNSIYWADTTIVPFLDEGDKPYQYIAIRYDKTEQKQSEINLRESEERFRLLVKSVKDYAIFMLDVNGNIASWNAGAERAKGYRANEVIGTHFRRFYTPEDQARQHPERELEIAIKEGRFEEEGWRVRKDGTRYWSNVVITAVRNHNGELHGFAKVTRDITERRRAEEERRRLLESEREARALAEEANRHKAEFLANMSHEIRTPMNGVIGMTRLLLKTDLTEEQREYSKTINQSADALLVIINDILDFSKIEAGKLHFEQIPFDLRAIVESTIALFAEQAARKNIELISFVHPAAQTFVCGDPNRLRQVLINLIGNALKFTETGEITIKVTTEIVKLTADSANAPSEIRDDESDREFRADTETAETERVRVLFEIVDTGVGISPETQQKLFNPFVQADGSMTRKFGGTGLGLAISRQLVELMRGEIGVKSKLGAGSTFWFSAFFELDETKTNEENQVFNSTALHNRRILIVDDNEASRRVLAQYVGAWGAAAVETVADSAVMLAEVRRATNANQAYDCIVLDSTISERHCLETIEQLRREPGGDDLHIVLLTVFGKRTDFADARRHGVNRFITKPVRPERLLDCLMNRNDDRKSAEKSLAETASKIGDSLLPSSSIAAIERKTVLIVEDNPVNQRVAQCHVEDLGYHAVVASTGFEALNLLSTNSKFDVILMDCQMPEMDGYEATAEIRRSKGDLRQTPIIAMTANALEGDRERCLDAGMDDYLSKPIDEAELARLLARWSNADAHAAQTQSKKEDKSNDEFDFAIVDFKFLRKFKPKPNGNDLIREFTELFFNDTEKRLETLRQAFDVADQDLCVRTLHALKGSCHNIGAVLMAKMCGDIESNAKNGLTPEIKTEFIKLEQIYWQTRAVFETASLEAF